MSRISTTSAIHRKSGADRRPRSVIGLAWTVVCFAAIGIAGCESSDPIVTYTVPTKVPEQLQAGKDRMLATIVPKGDQVWFFKVTGPEKSIETVETDFRNLVENIEFEDGKPLLASLPDGWRRGAEKPPRFATLDVETPGKQLNVTVSQLNRQDDWDQQIKMNVNRWRGQLGLSPSETKWADGEELKVAAADAASVWVDLVGETPSGGSTMSPPFAGPGLATRPTPSASPGPPEPSEPDPRLKFDRPDGWRDGRMTSMRMAAFSIGPEDSSAELTVIPAGGDLRGNVARWLGQVRKGKVPDDVVDQALADATEVNVDGRAGQRFLLTGEDASEGTVIDATIVPIENGMSLFVKMTGPAETVTGQSDAIASFLESLELNL